MKYTIKDFNKEFATDRDCMNYIVQARYGAKAKLYPIEGRMSVYAKPDGTQISPLKGTIFEKSATPLRLWFYAIFLFTTSKNGVSAKELERHLGVTYKCAWRIAHQIRTGMTEKGLTLFGTVEADETYIGGKGGHNKRGRGAENKTAVFGLVERKGNVKAQVVPNAQTKTLQPIINESVIKGSKIMTDEFLAYNKVSKNGYEHEAVKHYLKEYVRGQVHTNSIEGFWSQLKRSINGTYHAVSPKHLQTYVDEFSWRYNRRHASEPMFALALAKVVQG
jgi:transposase-like protein